MSARNKRSVRFDGIPPWVHNAEFRSRRDIARAFGIPKRLLGHSHFYASVEQRRRAQAAQLAVMFDDWWVQQILRRRG